MYSLITFLKIFPFFAIGLAAVLAQIGVHYRRRNQPAQWVFFSPAGFLAFLALLWLVFRGDVNSVIWAKTLFGQG